MAIVQQTFSMTYGGQTFRGSSGKINVFKMKCDGTFFRDFPDKALTKVSNRAIPASRTGASSHGTYYQNTYESKGGEVVLVQVTTTHNGKPWADAMMFLHLRDDAPLITVDVSMPPNRNAAMEEVHAFQGRADILELEELEDYGIVLAPAQISKYFDEEELEELFTIHTLREGTAKPKMVAIESRDGIVKKVPMPTEANRKVRIRRKS